MIIGFAVFLIIVIISALLAYLNMRDFQEVPTSQQDYTLYLIRTGFDPKQLEELYLFAQNQSVILSIERLFKGNESVLVIYGPRNLVHSFPQMGLLEIEDYLQAPSQPHLAPGSKRVALAQVTSWVIAPKADPNKQLPLEGDLFGEISLKPDQFFFWQLILFPLKKQRFQATIRAMVADNDSVSRIELVKTLDKLIQQKTGLVRSNKTVPADQLYESYYKRTLIPREVMPFTLNFNEVFGLLR